MFEQTTIRGPQPAGALQSIQSARGIAALLVAAFHLSLLMDNVEPWRGAVFRDLTWWGFRGVDFFFVLSGFIIMLAHGRDIGRRDRLGRYVWKRVSRIYPAYWVFTLGVLAISAVGSGVALGVLADPTTLLSTVTLIRFGPGDPPIGVAWTLFHEMVFYAAFAVLIFDRRIGIGLFLLWGAAILIAGLYPNPHTPIGTLIGTYNMNFFFGLGAYWAFRRMGQVPAAASLALAPLLLSLMIWLESQGGGTIPIHAGYALAFALAIFGAARLEAVGARMTLPGLSAIGDASYSIYLTHVVVQAYLVIIATRLDLLGLLPGPAAYVVLFVVTTVAGIVNYRLIERPLLTLTRRWVERRRMTQPAPTAPEPREAA